MWKFNVCHCLSSVRQPKLAYDLPPSAFYVLGLQEYSTMTGSLFWLHNTTSPLVFIKLHAHVSTVFSSKPDMFLL